MQNVKERVALTSIFASGGLALAKAAVGVLTGSLAIISEALHSLSDFLATVVTYFAVRFAGKPADEEHHYGHGKIESVAALAATAFLFVLSGIVIWEAGQRLFVDTSHAVEASFWAFAVIAVSILVDFFRARLLYRVAAETSSEALEADALHFGSDMWSSIAVLIGLGAVWLGYGWADSVAALVVAGFICIAGWRLARRTVSTLTDEAPTGIADQINGIVERVRGVVEIERTRVRRAGATLFVDLELAINRTLPLERVAALKLDVQKAIRQEFAQAEVNVVVMPRALDDESVTERILVIARNHGLAVHHITVHALGERLAVSLDIEVDGKLTLGAAHDIATALETAIEEELGPEVEVETHIEPLQVEDRAGTDASPKRVEEIRSLLAQFASALGPVREVHDVRVRDTADGAVVNFHCRADPVLTVAAVHAAVDDIESALRRSLPGIRRVIGHAEPRP